MENKKERIVELLKKIKKIHDVYVKASFDKQTKLLEASAFILDELASLGVDRVWAETLLMFGKEFLEFEKKKNSQLTLDEQPTEQQRLVDEALKEKSEPKEPQPVHIEPGRPATLEEIEEIFGAKAVDMTEWELRVYNLAMKHNALIWKVLSKEGEAPRIEVLSYQNRGIDKK